MISACTVNLVSGVNKQRLFGAAFPPGSDELACPVFLPGSPDRLLKLHRIAQLPEPVLLDILCRL